MDGGLHPSLFHHSLQALMDATKIKPTVLSWQSSSAGYTHNSALSTSKIQLCRCLATLTAKNHTCVLSLFSRVWLFATPCSVAHHQVSLSMGFSSQEHWNGLRYPLPGDLPNPGIKPGSPALQADSFTDWATREALYKYRASLLSMGSQRVGNDWETLSFSSVKIFFWIFEFWVT